ncbi:hypothetical protein A9Q98_05975 [Thalassotalea sp. 42_200_T64]|nr:hypothetical protein A9Q98_05975 [Thalassotalea sp. 42_200_T64]
MRGELFNTWSWEAAFTNSVNEATNSRLDVITANLQTALNGQAGENQDQFYHYLASSQEQNSEEIYDFIFGEFGYEAVSGQTVFDGHITGDLFDMPSGDTVGAAFGFQHREDRLKYDFNELSNELAFNFFGGGDDFNSSQNVWAVFAEFSVPVTDTLNMQVAVRYEDFDSASTIDPKVALLWAPNEDLSVRASWGTSFRVATVFQNDSQFITPQTANDPLAGGEELTFISLLTGDPDKPLKPQESEAINLGFTWFTPLGIAASIDYWSFDYTDFITPETPAALLSTDPDSEQIERNAAGEAVKITTYYRNAGSVKTDGIDFSFSSDFALGDFGQLKPVIDGTYILNYDLDDPNLGKIDGLGNVNDENSGVSTVQLRANLGLQWQNEAYAYIRYIGDYENDNEDDARVDSWTKIDVQYSYQMQPVFSIDNGHTLPLVH